MNLCLHTLKSDASRYFSYTGEEERRQPAGAGRKRTSVVHTVEPRPPPQVTAGRRGEGGAGGVKFTGYHAVRLEKSDEMTGNDNV